jgi:iron complex outermembrane receptor protein
MRDAGRFRTNRWSVVLLSAQGSVCNGRTALLKPAFIAGLLISLAIAHAQITPSRPSPTPGQIANAPTQGTELPQIVVTGYLIPRVGEGPQPVVTLDQDFISKQADQTVNDLLNRLPSGNSAQNAMTFAGISNSPASSAFGLHGLPPGSTLILVDGYRFPNYPIPLFAVENFVDINSIPLAAIDRVEILKDGASSTYGSDAVAGVVNLITKDTYNGADFTNYYGISQRGDFEVYHGSLTTGISGKLFGGNLSIVTAFDYYDQSPIESIDRWYAYGDRHKLAANYPNQGVAVFPANGSYIGTTTGNLYIVKPGTTGPNIRANDFFINGTPSQTYIPIDEQLAARENRYGGIINISYSPVEWLKFYDRFIIQRNEENGITPNQGLGSGDHINGRPIIIPANNPFNPFGEPLIPADGQLFREFGPWSSDIVSRTFRNIAGLTIQLPHGWFIDGSFLYGESDVTETYYNAVRKDQLQEALNGTLQGLKGKFFNPFTDENVSGNPNSIFYPALRTEQFADNRTDIVQWTLKAGGTLIELPSGPLTIAGGIEYRSESLIQSNDLNSRIDNIISTNFPGKLLSARRYIYSAYGEIDIPVAGQKWSWPGLRNLDFVFSERWDDYSDFGSAEKPKFAIAYKPVDDLTLRATYAEGYIAPSLGQLFGTPIVGLVNVFDPVKNQSYTVTLISGGNPHLKAQPAYSYYVEALWTPAAKDPNSWWNWAKGFSAYIDWFQVQIRDSISSVAPQTLVGAESVFPGGVTRNAAGFISQINSNEQILVTGLTDGIDLGATYVTKEYDWGKLDLEVNATYIYKFAIKTLVGLGNGRAGFLVLKEDDSFGIPDFKLVASFFYSKRVFGNDNFRTGLTLNYVASEHDGTDNFKGSLPAIDAGLNPPGYVHRIGSWTTLDWQISYAFGPTLEIVPATPKPGFDKDGKRLLGEQAITPTPEGSSRDWWRSLLNNTTVTFGVNNLFDTPPPLSSQGVSNYQGFDTLSTTPIQRYFYFQMERKF